MFAKLLIANRGEIAVRIIRACKEMGIWSVAVFSEADRDALHVSLADESYCIGRALARDSYLNADAIISAALASGAQAIHPGYGFLAENPAFAAACARYGIAFIGPDADVMRRMGDKDEARRTMHAAGMPIIPGSDVLPDEAAARQTAERIGYPVLIKARSGGGGRGIRRVNHAQELSDAFATASAEAQSAFGDGAVYMEKYLHPVKHVEMQVLCDTYGTVLCLGERDCSVQRRNQKLIEESPCPQLSAAQRAQMIELSTRAMRNTGYTGAGTLEFLLDSQGNFYFMEINTRLQVEHPVTEMVTGIDLVKWQIRIAAGLALDTTQADIALAGHAIECRINAEDPENGFQPGAGKITLLHVPGGPWVRCDTALYQEYEIPPFYDSMIAKLIVHARTREEAIRKMQAALCELVIEGVAHNSELQLRILGEAAFRDGSYATDLLLTGG